MMIWNFIANELPSAKPMPIEYLGPVEEVNIHIVRNEGEARTIFRKLFRTL